MDSGGCHPLCHPLHLWLQPRDVAKDHPSCSHGGGARHQGYLLRCSLLVFAAAVAIGTPMSAPTYLGAPILGISALLPVSFSSLRVDTSCSFSRLHSSCRCSLLTHPLLAPCTITLCRAEDVHTHVGSLGAGCSGHTLPCMIADSSGAVVRIWVLGGTGCVLRSLDPDSLSRRTVLLAVSSIVPQPAMYVALCAGCGGDR